MESTVYTVLAGINYQGVDQKFAKVFLNRHNAELFIESCSLADKRYGDSYTTYVYGRDQYDYMVIVDSQVMG